MSLARFGKSWDDGKIGFGNRSYTEARAAGYSASQINQFINSGGLRVGQRARDMASAGAAAEASAQAGFASKLDDQRKEYESKFADYQNQISGLTNQYNTALSQAKDWENQFAEKSAEYETARNEAERYRNEAVGQQLRAMKSGATTGGANATAQQGGLASGKIQYQPDSDRGIDIEKNIKAESGTLSGKGQVVERMVSAQPRQSAPRSRPNQALASGGGSGYYSSRFN